MFWVWKDFLFFIFFPLEPILERKRKGKKKKSWLHSRKNTPLCDHEMIVGCQHGSLKKKKKKKKNHISFSQGPRLQVYL